MIFDLPIRRAERSFDGETRRKRGVSLAGYCVRFKSDDPVNETQSVSNANQTDQRVGASDSAVAVGAGGFLDQSFTDKSETAVITTDNSDHSQVFTDNSTTNITTLDGELAQKALEGNAALASKAIDAVGANSADGFAFAGHSLEKAFSTAAALAKTSIDDSAAARAQQTEFLTQFYQDRAGTEAKASGDLIKYGAGVAALGLAFLIFKSRKAA